MTINCETSIRPRDQCRQSEDDEINHLDSQNKQNLASFLRSFHGKALLCNTFLCEAKHIVITGIKLATYQILQVVDKHLEKVAGSILVLLLLSSLWLLSFTISKGNLMLSTNSELFGLLVLLTTSLGCGVILKTFRLPSLLGMILIGLVWRNWNITQVNVISPLLNTNWSGILRYNIFSNRIHFDTGYLIAETWLQ